MKAFFHRLHLGGGNKDKDRDSTSIPKEKFPPLPSWPPQDQPKTTSAVLSTHTPPLATFKPLPEVIPSEFSSQLSPKPTTTSTLIESGLPPDPGSTISLTTPQPPSQPPSSDGHAQDSSTNNHDSSGRSSSRKTGSSSNHGHGTTAEVQKKVAFISPPPTPVVHDRAQTDVAVSTPPTSPPPPSSMNGPPKTPVTRFQATLTKDPRGSVSTNASSSKTDVATITKTSAKATSTRTASPYLQKAFDGPSAQSLRSGTPYSQMSAQTSGSRILAAASWSEVTEEDLVSNIGSRERTRQEVLFEIISSEDRYVQELAKMKDTFIDPLLHPYSTTVASTASTPNLEYDYYRAESPFESTDDLPPIAARFMSPTPSLQPPPSSRTRSGAHGEGELPETDEDEDEDGDRAGQLYSSTRRPGTNVVSGTDLSPYRQRSTGRATSASVPFPSRSHQSLPPPPRNQLSASTHSLGRQSALVERDQKEQERERTRKLSQGQDNSPQKGMLRKFRRSQTVATGILGDAVAPHQLPEDLRICLEVIDSGVFDGHKRLSEALKKRYDDQFPLVRSLADVFVSNSDIFHGYATYVLHLEKALEQVDAALANVSTKKPKKQDAGEWQKVCKYLQKLEENAADKGETGLAITLSKPFQRLLKYPLLFQNLLFHTDPSTFEYESTLQMVAEVENIVRSIEDEKIQKEERDKTRDVFARIEGLDKVRQLALPKPSRVLIEERMCVPGQNGLVGSPKLSPPPPPVSGTKGVKGKSSFKRLSDVLTSSGVGGKKDLWFVVFNDVVLQCQRTGTTSLPLVSSTSSRVNSLPEAQGKTKYATTGRRNVTTKPRNLYKFIKIETWAIGDVLQPKEGVVSMNDVAKSRAQALSTQPRIIPLPDDDERDDGDSDDSDKKSKMSFSYWGADKITVQKPVLKARPGAPPRRPGVMTSYGRESSANAKFGSRLVSDGSSHARPTSRRAQTATPTNRRPMPVDDGPNYAKATITRPAWDTSTSTRTPIPGAGVGTGAGNGPGGNGPGGGSINATKRSRNTSQASVATRTPIPGKSPIASPAPSEDSGVGLYRQFLATERSDPALQNTANSTPQRA